MIVKQKVKSKLTKIKLSGYKSIKNLSLELSDLNILIGANGSGKSNFVSFFRMLNFMIDKSDGLKTYVAEKGGANKLFYYGYKNTQSIYAELDLASNIGGKNKYIMTLSKSEGDSLFFTDEKVAYTAPGSLTDAVPISLGGGHVDTMMNNIGREHNQFRTVKSIKNVMRKWRFYQFHDTSKESFIKKYSSINDNKYLRDNGGNIASFLYMLRDEYPINYKKILMTVKQIAPFIEDFELEPGYEGKSILLGWRENNSEYSFTADQMSDGTLRTIALVTLLLQPNPPDLICLDEPELGLHPFAINVIASLINMAANKSQIIVSTQSATLINQFSLDDIVVVDRKNGISEFKRLTEEEYGHWLEDYTIAQLWDSNIFGGKPSR